MKKLIRNNCFETNSSSTHSIVMAKDNMDFILDTIYPDQDGVITVLGQEFGWSWMKFNDAITKLAYVFQDQDSQSHDMIVEVVKEQTGALEVIFDENGGYIDHDGYGTAHETCYSKESLRNFIFNKNSWLFTGNDNSTADPTFYDVPEFKNGRMIMPKYTHQLTIAGLDKTTKFKSKPTDEEVADGISALLEHGTLLTESGEFISDDSIFWQISRPRCYYEKSFYLVQDYSKNEILFLKENDMRFREIEQKFEGNKKLRWDTKYKKITEEALKVPGLVKIVKFELKPISANIILKD
jgi:hypothetical protein